MYDEERRGEKDERTNTDDDAISLHFRVLIPTAACVYIHHIIL